jgi:mono/diheme cytochrome c family protein
MAEQPGRFACSIRRDAMSSGTDQQHSTGRGRRFAVRAAGALLCSVAAGLGVLAAYVTYTWDRQWDAPLPEIHASSDAEVIRRGEYLVFGPAHCSECHTQSSADAELAAERGEHPPLAGGRFIVKSTEEDNISQRI